MEILAGIVKELRDKTGAGMMDCKRALEETQGDATKAIEILRTKGIATAEKRAGRATKEGIIDSYIHPGNRLGVLVEINCETDFVGRTGEIKTFAREIAMQVAASSPLVIKREDIPPEKIEKELEIYKNQAREMKKPDAVIEKIALGKLEKYYQEVCLLEQQYIKDPARSVKDLLMDLIAKTGENISIRRFARFRLGEDI